MKIEKENLRRNKNNIKTQNKWIASKYVDPRIITNKSLVKKKKKIEAIVYYY